MLRKITFFVKRDNYAWCPYQTERFVEALHKLGIKTHTISTDYPFRTMEEIPDEDLPDITCSLINVVGRRNHSFMRQKLRVPHMLYAVDPIPYYYQYLKNPLSIVSSIDLEDVHMHQKQGYDRTFYLPLATESNLQGSFVDSEKKYEVSYLGTCWDYEKAIQSWENVLGNKMTQMMCEACKRVFQGESQLQALEYILKREKQTPSLMTLSMMHEQIAFYTKGKDRIDLVRSIKDVPVHLFGSTFFHKNWATFFRGQKNIKIHLPVSFEESLKVMRESKILLNGAPQFMYGIHDRVLNGINAGAMVVTNHNKIIDAHFKDGEEIVTYPLGDYSKINERIKYYLKHPKERYAIIKKGREKVLKEHTWGHRAKSFVENMNKILHSHYASKNT